MKTNLHKKKNFTRKPFGYGSSLLVLFFMLFAFSGIEAQVTYEQDFEKGGKFEFKRYNNGKKGAWFWDTFKNSANHPTIEQAPGRSGKAGRFYLSKDGTNTTLSNKNWDGKPTGNRNDKCVPNIECTSRTEIVVTDQKGHFELGKEYWINLDYRYENWEKEVEAKPGRDYMIGPMQVHTRRSKGCNDSFGSATSNAPFLMKAYDNELRFLTKGAKVLWRGKIKLKQWVNLVVHFKLSYGGDGFVEVWQDGKNLGKVTGANYVEFDKCGGRMRSGFFKMGLYNAGWEVPKNPGQFKNVEREVWLDNLKIGKGSKNPFGKVDPPKDVPVTGVKLNSTSKTLEVGSTQQLTATVSPSDASNKSVRYTSSNAAVATVSDKGWVKAIKAGTATITVTTNDKGKTATAKMTVKAKPVDPGCDFTANAGNDITIDKGKSTQLSAEPVETTSGGNTTGKVLYKQDFEKGGKFETVGGMGVFYDNRNIKQSAPNRKGVSISKEQKRSGNYALKFDVDRTKGYYKRAEIVFNGAPGGGAMKFNKDYWISFDYYRADWKKDSKDKDVGPLQMHDAAPNYPDVKTNIACRPNGGQYYNNAPMFFQSQNGKLRLVSYGGKVLWEGPMLYKQWVSLKIHFRASTGDDGIIEAWRNGKKIGKTARGLNVPAVDKCGNKYGAYSRPFLKLGNYHPSWWDKATVDAYIKKYGQYDSERRVLYMDNISITEGGSGDTGGTDKYTYKWSPVTGLSDANIANPIANPSSTTTYTLTVTDKNGCSSTDQVKVTVKSGQPTVSSEAYWPFNGDADDASGNKNHGTVSGASFTEGKSGKALNFDGSNAYVNAGKFNVTGNKLTLAAWIKADSFGDGYKDARIISKASGTEEQDHTWMLSTIKDGSKVKLRFRLKTGGTTSTLISNTALTTAWSHVAATYDGTKMSVFINGVESNNTSKAGDITTSDNYIRIGDNPNGGKNFDGLIDEVHVMGKALTVADLKALMNSETNTNKDPTCIDVTAQAKYDFNGDAKDYIGGYDGVISGAHFVKGLANKALEFDGENDHVAIGDFDVKGNKMTLAAWFKADDFDTHDARIISKATGTAAQDHSWMLSTIKDKGSIKLRFRLKTGKTTSTLISNATIKSGRWVHAAVTYDGSKMRIYTNGLETGHMNKTGSIALSKAKVWIGDNPVGNRNFDGIIDQVLIYADALSSSQVSNLYSCTEQSKKIISTANINMELYPNPVGSSLHIRVAEEVISVTAWDMTGREVQVGYENNNVDVSKLALGNYILKVVLADGNVTSKLFIKK